MNLGGIFFTIFLLSCSIIFIMACCGSLDNSSLNPDTSSGGVFSKLKFSNSLGNSASSLKFW
jgi:hypothetical protein